MFKAAFDVICLGIAVTAFVMIASDMLLSDEVAKDAERDAQN
ncbi:hypothetical protein [Methylobacterium nigriterrae]